jgi:hypothetical protein
MRKGIVAFAAVAVAVSLGYGLWSLASAAGGADLEVYTARVQLTELRQLYADGYDVGQAQAVAGGGYDVQLVLTPSQRDALRELGLQPQLWRDAQGHTTMQLAMADMQDGFKVWRPYDGEGNIADELRQLAAAHPELVKLVVVGKTVQDREILALKVTKDANSTADGSRPAVLYSAMQHAREWIGLEVNRRLLHYFVDGYASDPAIAQLVDTRELWFLPVANPDGYEFTFQPNVRLWRKNMRDNNGDGQFDVSNDGVDLNRNFNSHWNYDINGSSSNPGGETFRGTDSASEPETKAMQGLLQRINFVFQVNYHSAAELLLYAEGWQDQTPSVDHAIFRALSGTPANSAIPGFVPMLSSGLYITNGETCDYAYDEVGTLCWTPELSNRGGTNTFVFPDDDAAVQAEFENNLPFALDVAKSTTDPTNPVSHLGNTIQPLIPVPFPISYGDPQVVEVNALRRLGEVTLKWSINDGPAQSAAVSEWAGGERYGVFGSVNYHKLRGTVSGAKPGDKVAVWFEGGGQTAEPFTYTLAQDSGNPVLVVAAEDYTGISPEYAKTDGPTYLNAYTVALDEAGLKADVYDIDARGRQAPSALGVLSHYRAVVWYTGDDIVPRATGMMDDTVDKYANDLQLAVRAFLNEGGKLLLTGKYAGYTYYRQDEYDPVANKPCDPNDQSDGCEYLVDDFLQYYLSSYTVLDNSGTAPDGTVHGVVGSSGPLEGLRLAFGTGTGAANQDHSLGLMATSRYMPAETYPQFASQRGAYFDNPALAPYTGERAIYSDYAGRGYQRLMRTVDLTGAASGSLEFWASLTTGTNRGILLVEAHTPGQDDWTTLADANGHTNQTLPGTCPMQNSVNTLNYHPHLAHYFTQEGTPGQMGAVCKPQGSSGAWNAATGSSGGWQKFSMDLTPYAGKQVELSISYVFNQQRLGLFLDDVSLTAGTKTDSTSFETDLGAWVITPAPQDSPVNPSDFKAAGADAVPMNAIVTTADTVYMGFGFEAIAGIAERTEVMCRTMNYLLGDTLTCAHTEPRPDPMYLPFAQKQR